MGQPHSWAHGASGAFGAEASMFPGVLTKFGLAEVLIFLIARLELEPLVDSWAPSKSQQAYWLYPKKYLLISALLRQTS